LHEGVRFIEHGIEPDPKAKMRHAPEAGASASQARLPGHNHTHKPCFRNANVEKDFRGSVIA
jgi:hypothetical protein